MGLRQHRSGILFLFATALPLLIYAPAPATAQPKPAGTDVAHDVIGSVVWRPIGPAQIGGRFVDIAVHPSDVYTVYMAHSTGGVFRTRNNGVTWESIFDFEGTTNVGAVTVAPSDPQTIWVGTGEGNNTAVWGKGVFKSTDGGKTWQNMGLRDSHQIPAGCIVVHPRNSDIVHVCAAGRLWGEGGERGVYKSVDGGKSWRRVLHVNERTGGTHMVMDPTNPDVLYAAMYERLRTPLQNIRTGPGSGIYKSIDGGETWQRLDNGLPTDPMRRIGLAIYPRDPRILLAVVGTDSTAMEGVFRSEDAGASWQRINDLAPSDYYGKIRINPQDDQDVWVLGVFLSRSRDGGRNFQLDMTERPARWVHGDHHAMWINPTDPRHMVLGTDGGIYFSFDDGVHWDYINTVPVGQFYEVSYNYQVPYRVCGGTQDNGSWCGPSDGWQYWGITDRDWFWVHGADGFYTQTDPRHPWRIYVGSQNGNYTRFDLRTHSKHSIRPEPKGASKEEIDGYCFDWNTPIAISHFDSSVLYYGGQYLFRLTDYGDEAEVMSPRLTGDGPSAACRALRTIAESRLDRRVIWTGSNDGVIHITRDGGRTWRDVTGNLPGGASRWDFYHVAGLAASRHHAGTAYVALDGKRSDDYAPHIFGTTDYGRTWVPLTNGLPDDGSVYVVREDHHNPDLLFAGTEFGVFTSIDRGRSWRRLNNNLPHVPVYDLQVHDRDNELIAGTYGRSIWIADIAPLQELGRIESAGAAHLFDIAPAWKYNTPRNLDIVGHRFFHTPRKDYGSAIRYHLARDAADSVTIQIRDSDGTVVRTLRSSGAAGLHRVQWDLRLEQPRPSRDDDPRRLAGGDSPGPRGVGRVPQVGAPTDARPGTYTAVLVVDGRTVSKPLEVRRLLPDEAGNRWHVLLPQER